MNGIGPWFLHMCMYNGTLLLPSVQQADVFHCLPIMWHMHYVPLVDMTDWTGNVHPYCLNSYIHDLWSVWCVIDAEGMMCALYMQAVRDGKQNFLEGYACSSLDHQGFAALHYAVMYHKVDTIKKLLPKCGKLSLCSVYCNTPSRRWHPRCLCGSFGQNLPGLWIVIKDNCTVSWWSTETW